MKILEFYFCVMTLFSCGNINKNNVNISKDDIDTSKNAISVNKKDTLIIGIAENRKVGAIVVSNEDKKGYVVDGLVFWDDSVYGKQVKVSGKLLIEEFKEPDLKPGEPIPQYMVGTKRTLLNPKWELVK